MAAQEALLAGATEIGASEASQFLGAARSNHRVEDAGQFVNDGGDWGLEQGKDEVGPPSGIERDLVRQKGERAQQFQRGVRFPALST